MNERENRIGGQWNVYTAQKRGRSHEERGMLCQDRVWYEERDSRQVIALADGISQKDIPGGVLDRILEMVCNFLLTDFEEYMEQKEEVIRYHLLLQVRREIETAAAKYRVPAGTFSSTLLAVCIDRNKNSFFSIHLGDGIIICRENGYRGLSYPVNGVCGNETYLTTSTGAHRQMKLRRGALNGITEFILLSDGVYDLPLSLDQVERTMEILKKSSYRFQLKADDQSVIMLCAQEDEAHGGKEEEN